MFKSGILVNYLLYLGRSMEQINEIDHFKVLEEKVGMLIGKLKSIKDERDSLKEKILEQEKNIKDLSGELKKQKETRDNTKVRIESILEKIEQLDI